MAEPRTVFDPTTGETPLEALGATDWATYVKQNTKRPTPGWEGGSRRASDFAAQTEFAKIFGRQPTASELAMFSSAFSSGDKNLLRGSAGRAAIAQYFNAFANSPQNVAANQQKKFQAEAPKFYDQINGLFQKSIGRDATQSEKDHFGSVMAQGGTDTYTLEQFLSTLPEAVKKQDETFRASLASTLQKQDEQYYSENILPAVEARAVKQGRSFDSSGIRNSMALAAQQQNRQREGFLTNLTAAQYAGSQGIAQDAYARAYGLANSSSDITSARLDANSAALYGRRNEMEDYNIQKQAYDQYLQRYGKRSGGAASGAAAGALSGAAAGTYVLPGWGTAIGGLIGGIGGYLGGR